MKTNPLTISDIKNFILTLKGVNINLSVNRGRKKIENFSAVVQNIYPSVFTVSVGEQNDLSIQTFSYSDVLCGDVKIVNK